MIWAVVVGALIILVVLWEAFETVVLPRRVTRRFRLTVVFYRTTWAPWKFIARHIRKISRRETFLSFYGPLSLLFLFTFWGIGLIVGFGLLYYSEAHVDSATSTLGSALYLSGTTLFTLGIGDVVPHTALGRFLVVAESGLGFGFLALVLSYLPVIYQAFSRREVNIVLLDARAGSPPTAGELLRRHSGPNGIESLTQLLRDWERSSAEILESHISYPAVAYFRSQHNNESWLTALAAMLDLTALLLSSTTEGELRQARLTFAMCRHTVVDLAQLFRTPPHSLPVERLPAAELDRLRAQLESTGFQIRKRQAAERKLSELRQMYEPYVQALSRYLYMEVPPWILAKEINDNWRTSAWGRISGFAVSSTVEADDHSD
ncbi:MAG: potassium channel family protein [Candidatus Acidiferrales bacterium]